MKEMPERFPWLDQHLVPVGESLRSLTENMLATVEAQETASGVRKRARKAVDQAAHRDLFDIVMANLALATLDPEAYEALSVRLGNAAGARSRYDHPAFGKQLPPLLAALHEASLAQVVVSTMRGAVSRMTPTAKLADLVLAAGVTLNDFGRHPAEECIVLARKLTPKDDPSRKVRVEYRDTATTRAMRDKLRRVNAYLEAADVTFVPDGLGAVNNRDRRVTRRFFIGPDDKPRFDRGGRLFGGFWQALPSARRQAIRIDGEPVADLDYSSMFIRLAYAHLGETPPVGDLYALPGLEGYRSGVKLAMNAMLWSTSNRRPAWPPEMGVGVGDDQHAREYPNSSAAHFKGRLPAGWSKPSMLITAIGLRHPILRPVFGKGIGPLLQFRESEVLMTVLSELQRRKVVALPLHDGVMVAMSRADEVTSVMEDGAGSMDGIALSVVKKDIPSTSTLSRGQSQGLHISSPHLQDQ